MLYLELLKDQLEKQKADFKKFSDLQTSDLDEYLGILEEIRTLSSEAVWEQVQDSDNIGAIPSFELDLRDKFSV